MSLQLPFINAERQKKLIPHFKFHPVVLKQTFFLGFASFKCSSACLKWWHCVCCATCSLFNSTTQNSQNTRFSAPENHTSCRSRIQDL